MRRGFAGRGSDVEGRGGCVAASRAGQRRGEWRCPGGHVARRGLACRIHVRLARSRSHSPCRALLPDEPDLALSFVLCQSGLGQPEKTHPSPKSRFRCVMSSCDATRRIRCWFLPCRLRLTRIGCMAASALSADGSSQRDLFAFVFVGGGVRLRRRTYR